MPRWLWFMPLGVLLVLTALTGFRLGWIDLRLTESAAIEAYAARYLREGGEGARRSDCTARPGQTVWLVIRCGHGEVWEYHVNRFGGLKQLFRPGESGDRLETTGGRPRI